MSTVSVRGPRRLGFAIEDQPGEMGMSSSAILMTGMKRAASTFGLAIIGMIAGFADTVRSDGHGLVAKILSCAPPPDLLM
jgi:hypothetical protein